MPNCPIFISLQDMLDPEFYLEKYAIVSGDSVRLQNGRYRDAFLLKNNENVDLENPQNSHAERRSIFVVTVPGINEWALDAERESCQVKCNAATEQVRLPSSSTMKRPLEDVETMESEKRSPNKAMGSTPNTTFSQNTVTSSLLSREYLLNSPIADRPGKACIVKVRVQHFRFNWGINSSTLVPLFETTKFVFSDVQ